MKAVKQMWIIYPDDINPMLHTLEDAGISANLRKGEWVISDAPQKPIKPIKEVTLIQDGPFRYARAEAVQIFDVEELMSALEFDGWLTTELQEKDGVKWLFIGKQGQAAKYEARFVRAIGNA